MMVMVLTGELPRCCVSSGGTCRAAEPWGAGHDALGIGMLGKHKMAECGANTITLWFIWSVVFRAASLLSHHSILKPHCCHYIYLCMTPVMIAIPDWFTEREMRCRETQGMFHKSKLHMKQSTVLVLTELSLNQASRVSWNMCLD